MPGFSKNGYRRAICRNPLAPSGEERPMAKEKKTKRELQAMARERLGCAVPVRRDANGGWYF
jgi:hypothetical protein